MITLAAMEDSTTEPGTTLKPTVSNLKKTMGTQLKLAHANMMHQKVK